MYEMVNIFEVFLPQLLRYPNPTDPLNGEAAALMMREPKTYEAKVKGKSRYLYLTSVTRLIRCQNMSQSTHRERPLRTPAKTPTTTMR
jgi:hypothetical protein